MTRTFPIYTLIHNSHSRRFILAASALALVAPAASAEILDQYTFGTTAPAILTPTTVGGGGGLLASPITGDAGINLDLASNASTPPASAPWLRIDPKAGNTTVAAAIAAAADFKFTLSTLPGFAMNLDSLTFDVARGGTSSTRGYAVQTSTDNFASTISSADVAAVRPTFTNVAVNLSAANYQNLSSITFKIFSYSGATGHSVEYDNITVNGTSTFTGYTWQGGTGVWDTVATNWSGPQTAYADSGKVLFSDAGTTGTVNVTQTGLSPNLITLTNSAKDYTFNGGNLNVATSLFKSGSAIATFNNTVSAGSVTADTGLLTVGATGKLTSANITVSPTGALAVAKGGVLGATGTLTVNGSLTLDNATQTVASLAGASTGSILLNDTVLELTGNSTYSGLINGSGSLKVTGGTVTLSGGNNYGGSTTVAGGALQLNNSTAAGFGGITVNNGGSLSLGASVSNTINLAAGSALGASVAGVTASSDLTVSGASTIKTFNPITGTTANDLVLTGMLQGSGDLNIASINGNLPDGSAFRLRGPNSTGANAYRGTVTVGQSAKLELQFADTQGSPMGTGKLVLAGGTTSTSNAGTFSIVNLRNNSLGSATLGNNVEITGIGSAYFNMLGNAPTGSAVNLGDLRIGDGQTVAAVSSNTGTGPYTLAFASVHLTGGLATFVPKPAGNSSYAGDNNISLGPISETVAGSGIIMNGATTLTLTGNSSYTGATTVNSGTLAVDGNISGSAVAVNAGTLRGTGTTGPLVMRGGTLSPGNGFGSLTTGNLAFEAGSTLSLEIGGNTAGSYDQVNVIGSLAFNAPVTLKLDFSTYDPVDGDSFVVLSNNLSDLISFGSADARFVFGSTQLNEGTVFTATSGSFTQDFQITYAGGTNGNDVVLTAVPEPGTASALLLGLGVLAGSRRRRNTRS